MVKYRALTKIIKLFPDAEAQLRKAGLSNAADFLKANEDLLRGYFEGRHLPLPNLDGISEVHR